MNFINGKRGMSPLIVTMLLVALAVALGAMVMSWGSSEVTKSEGRGCDQTKIEAQEAFGKQLICYDVATNKFKILLKNTGQSGLTNIIMKQISPDLKINEFVLPNSGLGVGGSYEYSVAYVKPEKIHIELIPEINFLGEKTFCINKAIVLNELPNC